MLLVKNCYALNPVIKVLYNSEKDHKAKYFQNKQGLQFNKLPGRQTHYTGLDGEKALI